MQIRVREVFGRIGSEMKERWVTVDAGSTMDEVSTAIRSAVEPLTRGIQKPIGKLWAE